jgi:hypothetical protein
MIFVTKAAMADVDYYAYGLNWRQKSAALSIPTVGY